jgi:hypothetical protein
MIKAKDLILGRMKSTPFNITKLIPFGIKVKSLYWVRKSREINDELEDLFGFIDDDMYNEAEIMLKSMQEKWEGIETPEWFFYEYLSQLTRAEAMINFIVIDDEIW